MKKYLLLIIAVLAAAQSVSAQRPKADDKRLWIDLQAVQHIGINKWSGVGYVNEGLPPASMTELRGVLNFSPYTVPWLKFFLDMGVGVMPAPAMKVSDIVRLPMPNSGTQYFVREMLSESGDDGASARFRIAAGLFGELHATEKLSIMPYLGAGGLSMPGRSYEMILKEEGSNMQYRTKYTWGMKPYDDYEPNGEMMGFMTGRLNFRYRVGEQLSLLLGLEYTHFFDSVNFYGRYSNTFNGNVHRSVKVKGNKMNMLGVSLGISFR